MYALKKYMTAVNVFLLVLIIGIVVINLFLAKYATLFSVVLNTVLVGIILITVFSIFITYRVITDKKVNKTLMKINFNIVSMMFPIIIKVAEIIGV